MTAQEIALKTEGQLADATPGEIMMNAPLLAQIDNMANRMAQAKATIPKHLAGNEGDCWAIIMQSIQWGMNPYVVAQKTHLVNGTLGYEAQLVNAVVKSSGAIQGAFKYEYEGEGASLACRVGAVIRGETDITWGQWLKVSDVTTKNSPLWKTNPPQQLGYLQVKNWTRAFAPEALLGVYTPDELQEIPQGEREVGPQTSDLNASLKGNNDDVIDVEPEPEQKPNAKQPMNGSPANSDIDDIILAIKSADSLDALSRVVADGAEFIGPDTPQEDKDNLNQAYSARKAELEAANSEVQF